MNKKIKKVIIPAAGWGTRFLPWTKAFSKEVLPILDKPILDYLVDEAISSGIDEVILIVSPRKDNIINYFNVNKELELFLKNNSKNKFLKILNATNDKCKITLITQTKPLGLGHAILKAYQLIDNEPFAVILADDLVKSTVPAIRQLIDVFNKEQKSTIGVEKIDWNNVEKYGILKYDNENYANATTFPILSAIEKPSRDNSPSNIAIMGRYVFTPLAMKLLNKLKIEPNKEMNLIDIFDELIKKEGIYAHKFNGTRYDLGSVEGFVKANIDYALEDKEIGAKIKEFIKNKK